LRCARRICSTIRSSSALLVVAGRCIAWYSPLRETESSSHIIGIEYRSR